MGKRIAPDHVAVQYCRLWRHHKAAMKRRDKVEFLDLSHALRIWAEMSDAASDVAEAEGFPARFSGHARPDAHKSILKGTRHHFLPLASGVHNSGVQVTDAMFVPGVALSAEQVKALYEAGRAKQLPHSQTFAQWLGSSVYQVPNNDTDGHPHLQIPRVAIIKRVANLLGASHPEGAEDDDQFDGRFDEYIRELHQIQIAGYPATYYQLLEIGKDVVLAFEPMFRSIEKRVLSSRQEIGPA